MRPAGFVLVGGNSTRMGRDKALLPVGDVTLAQSVASKVSAVAEPVALIGPPEKYAGLGYPVYPDLHPGSGPLGGMETALSLQLAEWNLILACDLPVISESLLRRLLAAVESAPRDRACVVPVTPDGQEHPLAAVYHVSCLPVLQTAVSNRELKVTDVLNQFNTTRVNVQDPTLLANANTPEDWAQMQGREFAQAERLHYIEFRHVYKTFDHPVLVDVSFSLDAGQTLAIIGRSGVGKSVTLGHIMGFIKPDQGRIFVAYQDITDYSEAEMRQIRKKVTMVFQSGALFDSLTVAENILFSLELREDYNEQNKEDVVAGLLRLVGLESFADAYPADLSTGYKRAVAIARALAAQPECILYDEPTTMVDPIMSDHIGNLMLRLKRDLKLTSVVVTHDLDLMRKVADTVVFLFEGKAIYFGPVSELEKADHPHIKEFLAMDEVAL